MHGWSLAIGRWGCMGLRTNIWATISEICLLNSSNMEGVDEIASKYRHTIGGLNKLGQNILNNLAHKQICFYFFF